MNNLFLSFSIAIGIAVSLALLSSRFDLEYYTSRVFPLIPILYALTYQALEALQSKKAKNTPAGKAEARAEAKAAEAKTAGAKAGEARSTLTQTLFRNITPGRIAAGVAVSFSIKFLFEILYTFLFLHFSGQTVDALYGGFSIETISRFVRGDHPWLSGSEGLSLLVLLVIAKSFGTGLWIGSTSKGRAMLEGVIVGAIVTLIGTVTNMLILYRQMEEMFERMAASFGFVVHTGFVVVITTQVLLYGLWSGVAQRARQERATNAALKKAAKSSRKPK